MGELSQRGVLWAYKAGAAAARAAPEPVAAGGSRVLGAALGRVMAGRRMMLERHLRRVHGEHLRGRALAREVRRTFDSYARYWVEAFRLPALTPAELDARMSYEGLEHVEDARARGRGVILALPHLGGWDFGGAWLATQGVPVTVVVEPVEPPELFEWFVAHRRSLGMNVVPLGEGAGTAVLGALARNEVVALLSDRDLQRNGPEVELFGERTTLPAGPATMAYRTGAALVPATVYFAGRTGHHAVARPPLALRRRGRLRDDVAALTQRLAGELEGLIRVAPDQWHVLQPNWPSDYELVERGG